MLELGIVDRLESLERAHGRPRANGALPLGIRVDEIRGWLALEEQLARIAPSRWEVVSDPVLASVLLNLTREVHAGPR